MADHVQFELELCVALGDFGDCELEELFVERDGCGPDDPEDVLDVGTGLVDYVVI